MKIPKKVKLLGQYLLWILLLGFIASQIFYITQTVTSSMEEEQMRTLQIVTEKITLKIREYVDARWEQLDYMTEALQQKDYGTTEALLKELKRVKRAHGLQTQESRVLLMDAKGYYYTAEHGKVALWENYESVESTISGGRKLTVAYLSELEEEQKGYVCCMRKLAQPIETEDGGYFPYMVLAMEEKVFDIDRSMGTYGTITDAFVMSDNGRKVSALVGYLELARSYNLLSALEEAEFRLGDSYEEMLQGLQAGACGASFIVYHGQEYFLSYHDLAINNWHTIFLMEKESMTDSISPVIYQVLVVLVLGFSVLAGIIFFAVIRRNQTNLKNQRLQQEAELAKQENRVKNEFMSRMSHDMRTPLNGIISLAAVAREKPEDAALVQECLENIGIASDNLLDLVSEVLDMSHLEHQGAEVRLEPMDLEVFLTNMYRMLQVRAKEQKLTLELNTENLQLPYVRGDRRALNHIFLNILSNAIKYTNAGGSIRFQASGVLENETTGRYHFVISDTGIGMSPEFVTHIWDRFAQEEGEEHARTRYMGVGLGMAITKELVDLLGGTISVESEKGVGSTFTIELPLTLCSREELPEEERSIPMKRSADSSSRSEELSGSEECSGEKPSEGEEEPRQAGFRVLLAEDVPMNRKAMSMLLEASGIRCDTAEDGRVALEKVTAHPEAYDAVLMDIMMPNMDGYEATRRIRSLPDKGAATLPIFALSANAYPEDCERSRAAGMNLHLTKPLSIPDIKKALEEWCKTKKEETT